MSADEIPSWASLADGETALAHIDDVIATFKRAHAGEVQP